ncbi:MAG TPA: hypothetical protein VGQ29_14420 [Gemmatimonadales bacterium]|jgi:hypothetical protein|nr:hypothetical protein [Gemmatimonadales bacterium]
MKHGFVLLLVLLTGASAPQRPITTPRELLAAMHARYDGKWYHTLTFLQHNTEHHPDSTVGHSTWREWLQAPGKLRIEFQPADSGNGVLFVNDSVYSFKNDSVLASRPFVHPLLVLGFDVYLQPVERTIAQLQQAPRVFDLSVLSEGTWDGRPVWIVGAKAGDLHRRQFWVDKERLLFVRMLEPTPRDSTKTADTRFNKYALAPSGGGWVSAEVEFLVDGEQQFLEQYDEIQTNGALPAILWDPRQWKAARAAR